MSAFSEVIILYQRDLVAPDSGNPSVVFDHDEPVTEASHLYLMFLDMGQSTRDWFNSLPGGSVTGEFYSSGMSVHETQGVLELDFANLPQPMPYVSHAVVFKGHLQFQIRINTNPSQFSGFPADFYLKIGFMVVPAAITFIG